MKNEWFININGCKEGPFTIQELKKDIRITPDTLVWKEGFESWVPIGTVKELEEVFKDEEPPKNEDEEDDHSIKFKKIDGTPSGQLTLAAQSDPGNFIIWLIIVLLILIWIFYHLRW